MEQKPVRLFPKIHSISDFLNTEHPTFHPETRMYEEYWEEQEKRCIVGMWGKDSPNGDRWRYMPGFLYFYINMWKILDIDEKNKSRKLISPKLRDVEWMLAYGWLTARGFSGFQDDEEFTCNEALKDLEDLWNKELPEGFDISESCVNSKGIVKTYVPAREYLYKTHTKPMGNPLFENGARNFFVLGSRGFGKDLDADTWVLTPSGKTQIKNIKVGDRVIGDDGKPTTVVSRTDFNDQLQYKMTLRDGREIICGGGHLWKVWHKDAAYWSVQETHAIEPKKFMIPITKEVEHESSLPPESIHLEAETYADCLLTDEERLFDDNILYAPIEQRWAFLRKVMDLRGFTRRDGRSSLKAYKKETLEQFSTLMRGLGLKPNKIIEGVKNKYISGYCELRLSAYKPLFTNVDKKYLQRLKPSKKALSRSTRIGILSIEPLEVRPSVCISVDNDSSLFLVNDYVVTHNSYFCSGAVIAHEFLFDGHKVFDDQYLFSPNTVEIFLGAALSDKSSQLASMVKMGFEHLPGSYGEGEDYYPSPFFKNCSGVLTPNNKQNPYRHKYKEREGGNWVEKGSRSAIYHGIYTTENPQAAVGGRYTIMVIEEVGLVPNVLSIHGANETCMTAGTLKFGSSFFIGTGGNMEKILESKIIFTDPSSYNVVPYEDKFEFRSKPIGFFMPAYYALAQYKDELGNTDLEKAFQYLEEIRDRKRKSSTSIAINEEMMARPIVPSEMFLTKEGNVFPIEELRARLATIEMKDLWTHRASVGFLDYVDDSKKEVTWREDLSRSQTLPIRTFNLDPYQGNIDGAIVVYEHPPEVIPAPTYTQSLYKIVYDPVKDDNMGTSLACILVYKGFSASWEGGLQDTIVAEYIGRLSKVNDIHEIAIKLSLYYNAKVMVENNIPDFIRYCRKNGYWNVLQPSPFLAISKVIKNPSRKYDVGVAMSSTLNTQCEQLLRQWLLEPWNRSDPDGDEARITIDKLYSTRILEELISYNRESNFDAVSALKILALWLSQDRIEPIELEAHSNRHEQFRDYVKSLRRGRRQQAIKTLYYDF